jgi:hypothetical protein
MAGSGVQLVSRDALAAGVINALINGWIAWRGFRAHPEIALSVDSIAAGSHSAIGSAVLTATALAFILALVNFAMAHRKAGSGKLSGGRALYGLALRGALTRALMVFGVCVAAAILWQRIVGTVMLSPLAAALVVAAVAGLVAAWLSGAIASDYELAQRRSVA